MIKNVLCIFMTLTFSITTANAKPLFKLKDFQIEQIDSKSIWLNYQNSKVKIEKIDTMRFKINNQLVVMSESDTLDQLEAKIKAAYNKSSNTSTSLDELFISKAHAFAPLMAALMGGILGFAIGDSTCRSKCAQLQPPTGYVTPAPATNAQ